ncbi:hypothetical protein [Youngiibacter fragilis]|uniref:Uncharacterized protein n=1 Tax=Youngiibacter fragilis 232.1 TaxID=994573 RepID=V7I1B2_9CLOT|nr:hypothetical protein [Youngiibacter fragilis]ETA79633.1 hypothetical protein T472_0215870 [Youngiibacter fragilis 232.1]
MFIELFCNVVHALVNFILILSPKRIIAGSEAMSRGHLLGAVRRYVSELLAG